MRALIYIFLFLLCGALIVGGQYLLSYLTVIAFGAFNVKLSLLQGFAIQFVVCAVLGVIGRARGGKD